MKTSIVITIAAILSALGCATGQPLPAQQVADVQSATRGAAELGARNNPQAQLHLKLAEEQLELAKVAMQNDDSERADGLLMRAKADAELAVALTRASTAAGEAKQAVDQSKVESSTNAQQGAAR
jgi:hypothetical protein